MSMMGTEQPKEYTDGRTKQSFKQDTDINYLLHKHARLGTISHLEKYQGQYGDFAAFDFHEASNQIALATTMFEQLPAEVKNEFDHDPAAFFEFVNDPENKDDLAEKLPALAAPRRQLPPKRPSADNPPPADPVPAPAPSPEPSDAT